MSLWNSLNKNIIITISAGLLLLPLPANNLWWREAFNSGHTLIFIVISFVIYSQLTVKAPSMGVRAAYFFVFVAGMMFGVVIEVVQSLVGRDTSWDDLYKNLFGLVAGLMLIAAYYQKGCSSCKKQFFYVLTAFSIVLLGALPLFQLSGHYIQRMNAFPVIVDFSAEWSGSFVRFNKTEMELRSGKADYNGKLFRFWFDAGRFPGISVIEPAPDWSAYSNLRFKVASGYDDDMDLFLRVHDKNHNNDHDDRFNQKLVIHPGLNEIVISLAQIEKGPLNRDLDLTNIAELIIYLSKVEKSKLLEISNIYLD